MGAKIDKGTLLMLAGLGLAGFGVWKLTQSGSTGSGGSSVPYAGNPTTDLGGGRTVIPQGGANTPNYSSSYAKYQQKLMEFQLYKAGLDFITNWFGAGDRRPNAGVTPGNIPIEDVTWADLGLG